MTAQVSKKRAGGRGRGAAASGGGATTAATTTTTTTTTSSGKKSSSSSLEDNRARVKKHEEEIAPGAVRSVLTQLGFLVLIIFGMIRDFTGYIWKPRRKVEKEGFAPLTADFEDFFARRMFRRVQDCWSRPINSCPGAWIDIMERESTDYNRILGYGFNVALRFTGKVVRCLNLGSYNYLGFGDPDSPTKDVVLRAVKDYGASTTSARRCVGTTALHDDLEKLVARFIGKPAAMVFGMGFGTNSTGIPSLAGPGSLIVSDAYNHSSIVTGARASGARVAVFRHNDVENLELVLRRAIVDGQPRTHRPWKKILIIVEGIYSMEGETGPLAEIVRVKKKYGCYLFVDEAHSIGALGRTGRGICEHEGVDPADVDVLMGTFTKSFGAVGGYLASSADVVAGLRATSASQAYSAGLSPPAAQQCIAALKMIMGEDGTDLGQQKIAALRDNANMFRRRLTNIGFRVIGDWDSPVIPIMLYDACKVAAFSRECLAVNLAVVVVGFPATPLLAARARICISAAHDRKDLEEALVKLEEVGKKVGVLYNRKSLCC